MRRSIHRILTAAAALPLALGVVSLTTAGSASALTVHPDIAGSAVNGWVINGNLSGDGSRAPC